MIAPDMATMLAFLFTDAALPAPVLQALLSRSVEQSFNAITVDGDTSTSDTILLAATGRPARRFRASPIRRCAAPSLCRGARCGHSRSGAPGGAGRRGCREVIEITVPAPRTDKAARRIALAIANSPLVKTAIAGEDANWGRIVMAVGKAGEKADRDKLGDCDRRLVGGQERHARPRLQGGGIMPHMQGRKIVIAADVGMGKGTGEGVDLRSHAPLYRHQCLLSQLIAPAGRLVHRLLTLAWKSPRRSRLFTCAR